MKKMKCFFYPLFFLFCFVIDRLSKMFVLTHLTSGHKKILSFFNLSTAWNKGVSWSLLSFTSSTATNMLTAFILCVIVSFGVYTFLRYKNNYNIIFELMVLAGALSNVVDRFLYGAVLDFLEFHLGTWYWPTFNIADVFIVIGVFGIVLKNIVEPHDRKN